MRNLKRALSLALASAMLLGMMVVGASAASYQDESGITKNEAVEVLTAVGIVGGDTTGNYNPTATLTRAEFCVMMANMLTGGKFDSALFSGASTPFTDIGGHWGQAYIAYCYSVGVIAGTSATTFEPDNTLTTAQASAILLSALGYNQNGEFGANGQFELNVTRWAQQAGLYNDLSVSANAGISRDNTAQLIFNALTNTTPVGYSSLAESYYTVGSSALSGVVYSGKDLDADISKSTVNNHANYYDKTLGYLNFGLEYGAAASDDFYRPAHQWISDNSSDIGTYGDDTVITYTKNMKAADLEKELKGYTFTSSTKSYTDGASGAACADLDGLAALTAKGTLVEIYANSQKEITNVVVINTYLAQADADYDKDDDELDITVLDGNVSLNGGEDTLDGEDFAIANYEKDDYLLITVANGKVKTVAPATVLEDATVTIVKDGSNITTGGTKYDYNKLATTNSALLIDGVTVTAGDEYNVILDAYGYVIGIEAYSASTSLADYAFVKDVSNSGFEYIAKLVFTDGTTKTVTVSKTAKGGAGSSLTEVGGTVAIGSIANGKLAKDSFVTFKVDKNGEYELTYVTTMSKADTTIDPDLGAAPITNVTNAGTTKTVFIAKDKAYTGVKNAPTVSTSSTVYYTLDGKYLEAVYVDAAGKATTNADEVVYILSTTPSKGKDADDNNFYVYDAIVDGAKTTISTNNSSLSAVGLYIVDSYTDGYADLKAATGNEYVASTAAVAGTDLYKDGTLTVTGSKAYSVDENVAVYTIDTTDGNAVKTISTGSINNQNAKGFDDITLVLSSDKTDAVVTAIYMVK